MPGLSNFHPDSLSFWLGFIAATIFWWVFLGVRPYFPKLVKAVKARIEEGRKKSEERLDEYLRRETLRRAQGMHLASSLFQLDEILVPPELLAPPPQFLGSNAAAPDTIVNQVVPYLPDWPEVSAQYNVPKLTLAKAVQNGVPIAVIGQPGSGKTVALADLASRLARRDSSLVEEARLFPILLHALDLPLSSGATEVDPTAILIKAVTAQASVLAQPQIPGFLRNILADGRAILLLDGLDELSPAELGSTVHFLSELLRKMPQLRMVAAASSSHLDGLTRLGFVPFTVACWGRSLKEDFLNRWSEMWSQHIAPEISKQIGKEPADPSAIQSWLSGDASYISPLELTFKVWGGYGGDLLGPTPMEAIAAGIRRLTQDTIPYEALSSLALEFVKQGRAGIPYAELDNFLSHQKFAPLASKEEEASSQTDLAHPQKSARKEKKISSGGQVLSLLLNRGLMVEHPGDILRFSHPVLAGYLAGCLATMEEVTSIATKMDWTLNQLTGQYYAAQNQGQPLVQSILSAEDTPLHTNLLTVARWIKDSPASAEWRQSVLRRLVSLVQSEPMTASVRARLLGAFLVSNDSSTPLLFKQLMISRSPDVRRLAALGAGGIQNAKLLDDLLVLLGDPEPNIRYSACLALASFDDPHAQEAITTVLTEGDEGLQQAAAEALAGKKPSGHEALKAALHTDNLLVRRSAVYGLAQVHEPWADQLLEKVAIEDGQWVVRTAAAQAVESQGKPNPYIPASLPHPSNAPWLIAYAGKQGVGISRGEVPTELLLQALKSGTTEERLAAMAYLRNMPDSNAAGLLSEIASADQGLVGEAALYSLWHIATAGGKLPALVKSY